MSGLFDSWRKYAVTDCATVAEFCEKHYKRERYTGRGAEYAAACLKTHTENVARDGFTFLSHHESNTGEIVSFYPTGAATPEPETGAE